MTDRADHAAATSASLGEHSVGGQRAIHDLAALAASTGTSTMLSSLGLNFGATEQLGGEHPDIAIKYESAATT